MKSLLSEKAYLSIASTVNENDVCEVRMGVNRQLLVITLNGKVWINNFSNKKPYIVDKQEIDSVLKIASGHSFYSIEEQLARGFFSAERGIRIGVAGEGIYLGTKLKSVKNLSSLVIRLPHQVFGIADSIMDVICKNGIFHNTLIVSKPSGGKTTLLREVCRNLSNMDYNVLVVDERNEIACKVDAISTMDLGKNTDVITFVNKTDAFEGVVRAMNPEIIAVDEIFGGEIAELVKIANCGVKLMATMHLTDIDLKTIEKYKDLLDIFEYVVVLDESKIGKIKKVVKVNDL